MIPLGEDNEEERVAIVSERENVTSDLVFDKERPLSYHCNGNIVLYMVMYTRKV
jgi:hypothetical protein